MRERDLIRSISQKTQASNPLLRKGIGDDCAVFSSASETEWLVSADMLVEGVHFDSSWHEPYLLGRKTLAVNLSDIAAMGGAPQFVLLCLALPASCDENWASAFMDGFFSLLNEHNCTLIGGDTVSSDKLTVSVTVLGTSARGRAIGRNGATPGDCVYVSGALGSAAAGLYLLQNDECIRKSKDGEFSVLIHEHLDPKPQLTLGRILEKTGLVSAMQDISDGIATDISHIATASGVAATIYEKDLPAHEQLIRLCSQRGLDQTAFQLRGGEDYQLIFTVKNGCGDRLAEMVRAETGIEIYRIGEIVQGQGVSLVTRSGAEIDIAYQGYEHCS